MGAESSTDDGLSLSLRLAVACFAELGAFLDSASEPELSLSEDASDDDEDTARN